MFRRPPRHGHEAGQRRDRLPAHPRDGRPVAAPVPARSGGEPHEEGPRHRPALQRRRRYRPGAARPAGGVNTPSAATPASSCRAPELLRPDGGDAERALRSDAEMFPAGFNALGLGRWSPCRRWAPSSAPGPTRWSTARRSARRAAASGPSTARDMENYGVPPDVLVDSTAADFRQGRDAQLEKAIEVLKSGLGARKSSTSSSAPAGSR